MEFGTNLKKVLEEMGVTQRELANRMGKEETYISRIINNRYNVSWRMINDIANALDISPACFFTDNQGELFKILLNELPEDLLEFLQSRKKPSMEVSFSYPGDFQYWSESLYRTTDKTYFLAGEGGPMSHYAKSIGNNTTTGGSNIRPLSTSEAIDWCEENDIDADTIIDEFNL